jgi:nucleotide-binding universal stress UspA family protein
VFKYILAPLDGSPAAEQALPYAQSLAKRVGIPLELLTVMPFAGYPEPLIGMEQDLREGIRTYLSKIAESLRMDALRATFKVLDGDPAEQILKEAGRVPDTLIALSTHGRSGLGRLVMGSVADRVVHHAGSPVLIVRAKEAAAGSGTPTFSSIIVPLDGSATAEQALPLAGELARALSLEMLLLRAVPLPTMYVGGGFAMDNAQVMQVALTAAEAEAKEYLSRAAQAQRRAGVAGVSQRVLIGHPANAILDTAHSVPGSMTVMTSHGRSGVGRWLLGSVADHVVRHSHGPVLLVRAK